MLAKPFNTSTGTNKIESPQALVIPDISDRLLVGNPEGIHMRPALSITKLALKLQEELSVVTLIQGRTYKGPDDKPWVDICQEYELATHGFGMKHFTLTSLCLLPDDFLHLGLTKLPDMKLAPKIFDSFRNLLQSPDHLQDGGNSPGFYPTFLDPILSNA